MTATTPPPPPAATVLAQSVESAPATAKACEVPDSILNIYDPDRKGGCSCDESRLDEAAANLSSPPANLHLIAACSVNFFYAGDEVLKGKILSVYTGPVMELMTLFVSKGNDDFILDDTKKINIPPLDMPDTSCVGADATIRLKRLHLDTSESDSQGYYLTDYSILSVGEFSKCANPYWDPDD